MSSPYQDYLADQLIEVLDRFAPVDGHASVVFES
jgi:hypothetical protein